MNSFFKVFLIASGIIVMILTIVTVSRLFSTDKKEYTQSPVVNSSVDMVQQAITAVSEQTFVSGQRVIQAEDFMNNGNTFKDPMNPTNYILSGNIGYCLENGFCPDRTDPQNFQIWFNSKDGVFYIRLLKQPVRTARLDAEQFLQRILNLSAVDLCDLNYYMSVSEYTSTKFAGQHLLFNSCAGTQQL